uniref:Bzip transcription factor n=1 Tax=Peronospora matthiolae TaxID=2874970 RepID=A0AAV1V619_9STRA
MAVVATVDHCNQELRCTLTQTNDQLLMTNNLEEKRAMRAMKKRLQDRLYQRKHRAKREQRIYSIEHDVQALKNKIAQLYRELQHRKLVVANAEAHRRQHLQVQQKPLQKHAQAIVMQFFRVYHYGYSLALAGLQERFLRSILTPDVVGAELHGVDAFVHQWRLYYRCFSLFILEPRAWRMQTTGDQSVTIEVEVIHYLRLHHHTIGMLFPSIKTGQVSLDVVRPLITDTTAVAGTFAFTIDRTGHVDKLIVKLQLLETLQRVLGSLESVVRLTKGGNLALSSGTITIA